MKYKEPMDQTMEQRRLVPVEIQAAICIRPLLKKERDDTVVLEAQSSSQEKRNVVALHPLPPKINGDSIAPSAALILQTMSPDTIQTGHDEEFRFDHVFSCNAQELVQSSTAPQSSLQNQVYTRLGRPMALRAMEALINNDDGATARTTQLLITMGSPASGKSHICWGPSPVTKRKTTQDGLILRMVDSFFGQFDRLRTKAAPGTNTHHYALNLSFVQVNQDAYGNSQHACELHDLLQHVRGSPKASHMLSPHVKAFTRWVPKKSSSSYSSSDSLEETIVLEQDPETKDFQVQNRTIQTCRSMEEARDAIQEALSNSRKLGGKKRYQAHVFVQMQPVILHKSKASPRVIKKGGVIAVLDMAGVDESERKCSRRIRSTASLVHQSDAHTALIHCLRSLQYNELLRVGRTPLSEALDEADDDDEATKMSEITCSVMTAPKDVLHRQPSFKKVPFPRHKLTMLLQTLFSRTYTDETNVTMLMAASPGTRDYNEKKGLMQELEAFVNARNGPARTVTTGLLQQPIAEDMTGEAVAKQNAKPKPVNVEKQNGRRNHNKTVTLDERKQQFSSPPRSKHVRTMTRHGSEADDEADPSPSIAHSVGRRHPPSSKKGSPGVFCDREKDSINAPAIQTAASMTYSDTSEELETFTMPPPIAPPPAWRSSPSARYLESPNASAPREAEVRQITDLKPLHPNFSEDDEEGPPVPPTEHYSSTTVGANAYFRPMQHKLKKAVNMGKKKCGKVWEKVYTNNLGGGTNRNDEGFTDGAPSGRDEAQFVSEVERLRRNLLEKEQECDKLRSEVETLRRENKSLRNVKMERDELRQKCDQLQIIQQQQEGDSVHDKTEYSVEELSHFSQKIPAKTLTPRSQAYADITAPVLPSLGNNRGFDEKGTGDGESIREVKENLTPRSSAYADLTAPSLPISDTKWSYDRTHTANSTTTTATGSRPLVCNSLKAHMAKLSAKGPVVPSPAGSPWNKW